MTINDKILELIKKNLMLIMEKDIEYYSKYNILISNEQQYVKEKERKSGNIYIVVRFLPSTIIFGQKVLPITINAIAEKNKIETCQRLLLEFSETYTLTFNEDETIYQTYTTPTVLSNFNEIFNGFRSLLYLSGSYLISESSNPFKVYIHGEEEPIPCISITPSFDVQLDSQAFYGNNNFTKSVARIGTFSISITTYLYDNDFINKAIKMALKTEPVNSSFYFDLKFKNGLKLENIECKIINATFSQNVGEFPIVTLSFTN